MTEFELLVIPLSVVLGVGMTRILSGLIFVIRHRERAATHWVPIAWGAFVFMYIMTFFFALWAINSANPSWTWPIFGMQLVYAVLLYLSAGMVLTTDDLATELGMLENFERHGRLALIPLGLSFALAIPFNKWSGGPDWLSPQNFLNVVLLGLSVLTYRSLTATWRSVGTVAFGLVSALGWFVFFAAPGQP